MTLLEQLITQQVSASVVATLSRTTEQIAEQMAQEILKDPEFRARMRDIVTRAFEHALVSLDNPRTEIAHQRTKAKSG